MVSLPLFGTTRDTWRETRLLRLRLSSLVTLLVALILVVQWAVVSYSIWRSRVDTVAFAADNAARLVQLMETDAARVLQIVQQVFTVATDFVRNDVAMDPRFDYRLNILGLGTIAEVPQIAGFAVVDETGRAHALGMADALTNAADSADRDFVSIWQTRTEPGLYIGAPTTSRLTGRMILPISTQVTAQGRRWVLVITLDLDQFRNVYESIRRLPSDSASLARTDGLMLMRAPYDPAVVGMSLARGRIFADHLPRADRGTFADRVVLDGTERIVSYSRVPDSDLLVAFTLTVDDALQQWRQDLSVTIPAFLIINALMIAMAVAIVHLIRRTERHTAELSRALYAAEGASRAKSAFLANMSHELRTPLNAIIGFGEIMKLETFGPLGSDRYRQYAGHIHDSAHELLSLINEILDLSRIEAGKFELTPERFSVADELAFCHSLMEGAAQGGRIRLHMRVEPADLIIATDRRALRRILLNLVSNAVKFTPTQGAVEVAVRRGDAGETVVTVTDTGIGIPADQIDRVLEPFVQVRDVMDRPHTGSGLGLAITRALAQRLGGRLTLVSTAGQGTTVTLVLPATMPAAGTGNRSA